MALYSLFSCFTFLFFLHGVSTTSLQLCDSCFTEFNSAFGQLESLLESTVSDMVELSRLDEQVNENWQVCNGNTVTPSSSTSVRSGSSSSWYTTKFTGSTSPGSRSTTSQPIWDISTTKTSANPNVGSSNPQYTTKSASVTPGGQVSTTPARQSLSGVQYTTKSSGVSQSPENGNSSAPSLPAGWSTTTEKSSGPSNRLIIGVVLGSVFGGLLIFGMVGWCLASRSQASPRALQALAQPKPDGYGNFPPVQQQNPYVYQNRYYPGVINM